MVLIAVVRVSVPIDEVEQGLEVGVLSRVDLGDLY